MGKTLLTLGCCWVFLSANAQGIGEVHAAPGMPVHLQRGIPTVPARRHPVATAAGAIGKVPPPVLARFWQLPDTAKLRAVQPLHRFFSSQAKYPTTTLQAQVEGKIYARLTVLADGTVSAVAITRRDFLGEPDPLTAAKGIADLDAEVTRVMKLIRFEPGSAASDTVTVTTMFRMQ
jgi:hypothetical protein